MTQPRIRVLEVRDRKDVDGRPFAWIIVEREEKIVLDERGGSVARASIRLKYMRVSPKGYAQFGGGGEFCGGYERDFEGECSVSVTSESLYNGAVFLDPGDLRGQHIGSYLMNEIVCWARQWPDASVNHVELVANQAYAENKTRRNRFYERFGLVFDYKDPQQTEGLSRKMPAGNLKCVDSWRQNIRELSVPDFIGEILEENQRLAFKFERIDDMRRRLDKQLTAICQKPVRWAVGSFIKHVLPSFAGPIFLIVLCLLAWFQFKA